jgi:broad specificity phosphatase PhoE
VCSTPPVVPTPGNGTARVRLVASAAHPPGPRPSFPGGGEAPAALPAEDLGPVRGHLGRWTTAVRGPEPAAQATADALGADEVAIAEELRAPSFGTWAGRPLDEVLSEDPEAATRWRTDPTWAPPDGESLADLCTRVDGWLARAVDGERTLAVADSAVVRAAAVVALGAAPASCWRLDVGPLTVVRLQRHDGTWRLRAIHPA